MSKSSRKRSRAKREFADKASMEERKPLSHFVLGFFLLLWNLGRKLFRKEKKEPSEENSRERPDAASCSSVLAAPYGMSVAATHASEEKTEGPTEEVLSFGTVNDKGSCADPSSTGHSNEVMTLDPEVLEAEFSRNGFMVGEIFCPDRVGFRKSNKEEAKVESLKRLPVEQIEDDEVKYERSGSDSEDWKKRYHDEKERNDLKVELRQVLSRYGKTPEGKIMEAEIKEELLNLVAAKDEKIDMVLDYASYTTILRMMFFQSANMNLKSNFWRSDWRARHRFPKFSDDDADYLWWEQNFDPETLERRLQILRVAAKKWNPELDMFMIIKLVSEFNASLHPQPSENELNEKDEVKMSRLLTRICDLDSGGDSKIQ